ncbi:MarR family winged helix-turn-helix transcriptional regulator [Streptomyces sp. NBC_01618]|uniref:MarR family winged helix-turn-helix transcriptional regulator n=1 Tax=Streptomyces sp. NBC_01618 TaxID=2975900 RepID=UPI00386F3B01|nr:MarR family winged helix-turn-helix transcriptional regulator [Streptomyces sp. NBC_01618]
MSSGDRAELATALDQELRSLVSRSVLFHQAVADRLGLNVLDLNCLGALVTRGSMAAGQLAEENGVTTGAITGVIDRLEAAGHVRRDRDPKDRRRVLVTPLPNLEAQIFPLFASLGASIGRLCEQYSDEELETVLGFMRAAAPITHEEAVKLRAGDSSKSGRGGR